MCRRDEAAVGITHTLRQHLTHNPAHKSNTIVTKYQAQQHLSVGVEAKCAGGMKRQ
jgi:hypothetical protein